MHSSFVVKTCFLLLCLACLTQVRRKKKAFSSFIYKKKERRFWLPLILLFLFVFFFFFFFKAAEEGRKKRIDFIKYESKYGLSLHDFSVLQILVLGSGDQHDQLTVENGNITIARAYLDLLLPDDRSSLPAGQYILIDNQGPDAITGYFINTPEGSCLPSPSLKTAAEIE